LTGKKYWFVLPHFNVNIFLHLRDRRWVAEVFVDVRIL
jgi:hypothetical protein